MVIVGNPRFLFSVSGTKHYWKILMDPHSVEIKYRCGVKYFRISTNI